MDNRNASTEQSISNDYKEGEMGNGNKNRSIEEKLSGAIGNIDANQVKGLVEKDTNVTESILSEALKKANERIENLKEGDKKQDQKDRLTQIIELLETKLKSIRAEAAAPSVDDSAATGSQATPAAEPKESEEDQPDSPSLSPQSSVSGHSSSSSSFVNVSESNGSVTDSSNGEYVKVSSGSGSGSSFEEVGEDKNVFTPRSSSPQDIQPGISTSKPSGTGAEGGKKKQTPVQPAKDIAQIDDDDGYDLSWLFSEEGEQIPHPESEPIPSLISKKSEQVNNTTPQNTESSNLHIIAASILVIAGVALGVAIAVHLGMPAVGILVGVYCLVAAAVMYHCKWPSSFIENSKVEKVAPNEKKEPVATSV
ncbi:MAG: hypothetical protein PG978_000036 [Wolbachia endosymbiont of Ctenocephalides felis wCfeF]|nr:MAG: hypothetical protein PG978_000036 [Wolbachia endosymbiont of Ctenocephalides felis wCfeF]